MCRKALTVVEVLVVLAILGALIALLLPAVQSVRESGRRTHCSTNLRQMALALHQYADFHGTLPASARAGNWTFHVSLLPHLEQEALYHQFVSSGVNATDYWGPLFSVRMPTYECPSDGGRALSDDGTFLARTNYQGNSGTGSSRYGYNGLFMHSYSEHPLGSIRYCPLSAVTDGLSQTAMLAEIASGDGSTDVRRCVWKLSTTGADLDAFMSQCRTAPATAHPLLVPRRGCPWPEARMLWSVYNHVLTPNSPSCLAGMSVRDSILTSSSMHPSIVNVAHADGSVLATSDSIDEVVWQKLGSRAGRP